jgi:DNA-binding GntR family transcriptional regulator
MRMSLLPSATASLEPIGSDSLAARIADRLVDAIASNALQPGQRLIETEIARALGVSRMPLREGLKLLEAQGILAVTPRIRSARRGWRWSVWLCGMRPASCAPTRSAPRHWTA